MLTKQSFIEKQFITRPGEKLLFAARRHIYSLLLPIISIAIFVIATSAIPVLLQRFIQFPLFILIGVIFFAVLAAATVFMKLIVDWYFYFYIVTNYKILEVSYKPFFSKNISVIPLDQLRCVEVTSNTFGLINTIYDIGDVTIFLDFLTHQDTFVMTDIASPQKTSIMLSDKFNAIITTRGQDKTVAPLPLVPREKDKQTHNTQNNITRRFIYHNTATNAQI